jgi:hypothetical protein
VWPAVSGAKALAASQETDWSVPDIAAGPVVHGELCSGYSTLKTNKGFLEMDPRPNALHKPS